MESLRRNKKEMLENKNKKERKSALGGLINRLDTTEEIISEFENMSIETFKSEKKKKRLKSWNKISNNCGTHKQVEI